MNVSKALLVFGLIATPLAGDSITKSGWVYGTPLPSNTVRLDPESEPFADSVVTATNDAAVSASKERASAIARFASVRQSRFHQTDITTSMAIASCSGVKETTESCSTVENEGLRSPSEFSAGLL
jgi:hypothetical protein